MLRIWVLSPSCQISTTSVLRRDYTVYFGCHYEVALGQAVNFVGTKGDFDFPPGQQNVGVMPLFFGERSHPVYEIQGLLEIGEGEGASYVVFVDHFPVRPIRELLVNFG